MGQYFLALNPGRNEHVTAPSLGAGPKLKEILHSAASVLDGIAILMADPGSGRRRPADLHVRGLSGRWAAERCLLVGDGPAGNSVEPWPWAIREADMYGLALAEGTTVGPRLSSDIARAHGLVMATRTIRIRDLDGTVEKVRSAVTVPVSLRDGRVVVDQPEMEAYAAEYADAARKAAGVAQDRFVIDARDGTRRLVANLDKRQYIDPRHLSEFPTLLGMLRGHGKGWDPEDLEERERPPSTLLLLGEMMSPGDGYQDRISARWRGDRILLTAETSKDHPTTEGIERDPSWADVTPRLLSMMEAADWTHYNRRMHRQIYGEIHP